MHRRKFMAREVLTALTRGNGDKYIGKIVFQKVRKTA